jgi:PAS domain S-box-containing protein
LGLGLAIGGTALAEAVAHIDSEGFLPPALLLLSVVCTTALYGWRSGLPGLILGLLFFARFFVWNDARQTSAVEISPHWATWSALLGMAFGAGDLVHRRKQQAGGSSEPSSIANAQQAGRIFELAPEALIVTDAEGRLEKWNNLAALIFGWSPNDAEGKLYFQHSLPPHHQEAFRRAVKDPGESVKWPISGRTLEISALRADGREFPVELTINRTRFGGQIWLNIFLRDITERKRNESQVHQSQRMEALGRFAGGIAHDLNNTLTVICGYGEMIQQMVAEQAPLESYAREIVKASGMASTMTRHLLAFSRRQVLVPKVVRLNTIVTNMEPMLRRIIREDIALELELAKDLDQTETDAAQMEQVLMNLIINARDAMPKGGVINLRTSNIHVSEGEASRYLDAKPGPHVLLEVSDTGQGMDKETQAHLFEPFFTTKAEAGTGLGLSTVYGIVRQSGGHIRVRSDLGKGSVFSVLLPRVQANVNFPAPAAARPPSGVGRETILFVEDSDVIRKIARETLRQKGYAVLEAADGLEALRVASDHPDEIQILITDVVMPKMGGYDLARRLKSLRPGLKTLYVSGYANSVFVNADFLKTNPTFLRKPFTPSELAAKIREVLDSPASDSSESMTASNGA